MENVFMCPNASHSPCSCDTGQEITGASVMRTAKVLGSRGGEKDWHTEEYRQYLQSAGWKARREGVLKRDNYICRRCGKPATDVHHRTYERLGKEFGSDLESLCHACHQAADQERQQKTASKNATALYSARLNGWASKRYGDDWDQHGDSDVIEQEFDLWVGDS